MPGRGGRGASSWVSKLALSHPRWKAATARGRAASGLVADVRAAGGGLAEVAEAYGRVATPRSLGRAPAVRSYEAACRETGDAPWPDDVEKLARQMEGFAVILCERGLAPPTARRYAGSLVAHARARGVVWGGRERGIHAHVAALAADFPHEARRARAFDDAMLSQVMRYLGPLAAAGNAHAAMWRALLLLMYASMLRLGEACDTALRWWMLSERPGGGLQVLLPWRKTKKGEVSRKLDTYAVTERPAPLNARVALHAYARLVGAKIGSGQGVVFARRLPSGKMTSGSLYRWFNVDFRRICRLAGVPPPADFERETSHGGRRGFNTALGRAGVSTGARGKLGGWTSERGQAPYDESGGAVADMAAVMLATAAGASLAVAAPPVAVTLAMAPGTARMAAAPSAVARKGLEVRGWCGRSPTSEGSTQNRGVKRRWGAAGRR